jgi:hypothetical protein
MILFELTQNEQHPAYQELEIANGNRQYNFIQSLVGAALALGNFQAIACLHTNAGEYRPCPVVVGDYNPPEHFHVEALMEDFVNEVNINWASTDPVVLGSYVLWRMNFIHPFINGNGRTARAACYFIVCVKSGGWLVGDPILPELIRQNRNEYVSALKIADKGFQATGTADLAPLHGLLSRLLSEQIASANVSPTNS